MLASDAEVPCLWNLPKAVLNIKMMKDMWWKFILGVAGLIGLALIIAVIKMAITEAKEEAGDIERASGNK